MCVRKMQDKQFDLALTPPMHVARHEVRDNMHEGKRY